MSKQGPQSQSPRGGHANMFVGLDKPKEFKETFRRLIAYLRPQFISIIFVFIIAILGTAFAVLGPKVMGNTITVIFDGVTAKLQGVDNATIDFTKVGQWLLLLAALYLFSSLFQFIQQFTMAKVAQKTVYDLRSDVFNKLEKLPLRFFDKHSHGDILSRVTNDIDTIATTLQQTIVQFITSLVTMLGILIMMLWISPLLTTIAIISIPLSFFVIKPLLKKSQHYFGEQQRAIGQLNGHIEEMYTGQEVVKAFGYEEKSIAHFNDVNGELFHAGRKAQFISGIIMPLMGFIGNFSYVFISIMGGILVINRTITIGDIQAFITYTKQFSQPISQTANIANIIQSTIAAAERVFELLDEQEENKVDKPHQLNNVKGNIEFVDIAFGYEEHLLMENVHLQIESGQIVAIVGPTGAGKTTLVNLLLRFYELNSGKILIDGVDIAKVTRSNLREQFGIVSQEVWLFKGTIKENIAYGKTGATDQMVYEAAKRAYAHDFIEKLPDGYETILNEDASNISVGQKQLITIARAMLTNSPMMILDEATSSVDTRTEVYIQSALAELMAERTSFVIAHRLSTIQNADLILVMDQGAIVEQGRHGELLAKKGFYYDLFESQFRENQAG